MSVQDNITYTRDMFESLGLKRYLKYLLNIYTYISKSLKRI